LITLGNKKIREIFFSSIGSPRLIKSCMKKEKKKGETEAIDLIII
jgi:hypothetical protein